MNSFAADDCCSYQSTGYQVEEYIGSHIAEDGCNNITISCARREGRPRIVFQVENTCTTPVSEDMFNSKVLLALSLIVFIILWKIV